MVPHATFITAYSLFSGRPRDSKLAEATWVYLEGSRPWIWLDVPGLENGEYCQSLIPSWIASKNSKHILLVAKWSRRMKITLWNIVWYRTGKLERSNVQGECTAVFFSTGRLFNLMRLKCRQDVAVTCTNKDFHQGRLYVFKDILCKIIY